MTEIVDMFTRKNFLELQEKKAKEEEEYNQYIKESLQELIDKQQEMLDNGNLTGLMFCATTESGYITPEVFAPTPKDYIYFNYCSDYFKDICLNMLALNQMQQEGDYYDD